MHFPISMAEAARALSVGPIQLRRELRAMQVLNKNNLPNRRYSAQGLFTTEIRSFQHRALGEKAYAVTLVTEKGLLWLRDNLNKQQKAS